MVRRTQSEIVFSRFMWSSHYNERDCLYQVRHYKFLQLFLISICEDQ